MYDTIDIVFRSLWSGIAALGFAVLFNAPYKALYPIIALGCICGLVKTIMLNLGSTVVEATWAASLTVGVLCIPTCKKFDLHPFAVAFLSVISMIPGYFAYRTFLGLIELSSDAKKNEIITLLTTVDNALKVFFILTALAAGVTLPILALRSNFWNKN